MSAMIKIQQYLYLAILTLISVALLSVAVVTAVSAEESIAEADLLPVHDLSRCAPDGIALGGFDAVSYQTSDSPIFGNEELKSEYEGLFYQFSSQENLDKFNADPKTYLPAFGGWCAIAVALGKLTCPDYTNYKIENGQLLLFETVAFSNGRHVWNADPMRYFNKAITNFEELSDPEQ